MSHLARLLFSCFFVENTSTHQLSSGFGACLTHKERTAVVQSASGGEGSGLSCLFVSRKWLDRIYRHCHLLTMNNEAMPVQGLLNSTMLSMTKCIGSSSS